jgi:ABC-type Fe3+-siderophore transport system permease subunit
MNAIARWTLTGLAVLGLAVDAYTHFDLATQYQFNRTSTVSQETLFRLEAVLAIVAAVAIIVRANIWTALLVIAVAGGGLALLLIYRYVNVGQLGPLPNMYEPLWFTEKSWSAVGEAVAAVAALGLLGGVLIGRRRTAA